MTEGQRYVLIRYLSRAGMAWGFAVGSWELLGGTLLIIIPILCAFGAMVIPFLPDSTAQIMRQEWRAGIKQRQEKQRQEAERAMSGRLAQMYVEALSRQAAGQVLKEVPPITRRDRWVVEMLAEMEAMK
ncbi:hypothetical protein [Deinococcus sp. Leaf326]|uniref:hypothetical protein n=1 Tax=Deinococcus sp. Leaf326 TaxID=1736338 RepID=UPI0006FAE97D|nr:hypothetical protein [Deinococcus sp. Leaf326]KQR22899.1 hypothetical protein ASF71_06950 [Deinococcus sp. Leaf326]